jgi:hypothetical protein
MEEAQPVAVSRLNHTTVKHKFLRITYPPFNEKYFPLGSEKPLGCRQWMVIQRLKLVDRNKR